jgi:hypothetical protein
MSMAGAARSERPKTGMIRFLYPRIRQNVRTCGLAHFLNEGLAAAYITHLLRHGGVDTCAAIRIGA